MRSPFLLAMVLVIPLPAGAVPTAAATLTKKQVIEMANAAAKKKGYKLESYEVPKVEYEAERKDGVWWVFYKDKVLRPGGYFHVTVDDKTKATKVLPGE